MKDRGLARAGLAWLLIFPLTTSCSVERQKDRTSPATKHVVTIKEMQFLPTTTTANPGDTVVFVNHDMLVHDVTEASKKAWTSGPIPVSQSFVLVVERPVSYYCSIHPTMQGKIVTR